MLSTITVAGWPERGVKVQTAELVWEGCGVRWHVG